MEPDLSKAVIREVATLRKFEGDPEDGKLLETIKLVDGVVVEVTKHQEA